MATPERFPVESQVNELVATYRAAQRQILAEIRAATLRDDPRQAFRRTAQLQSVIQTLDQLGYDTDDQARRIVAEAFGQSSKATGKEITRIGVTAPTDSSFAGVAREAVSALQESMVGSLTDARQTIGRQAADVFARAQRRTSMLALLGAEGSPASARKNLVETLQKQGQTGFVDRAGRRWSLDSYADMATRTVTRQAVTQGAITRMAAHGIDLARISVHASSCNVCKPWEGRLVSLDGSTTDYEGEAVTDLGALPSGGPPFHPRCKHSLSPVAVRIDAIRRQMQEA